MLIISVTFINLYRSYLYFLQGVGMSMMFGYARGSYCLGFTKVQIRFLFDDSFVSYFFMKSYVVGTQDHYNHLFDKIIICNHSNSFFMKK